MKRFSAVARLTLWCVAILALGEILFGAATWFTVRRDLYDLVDKQVERQADDLKILLDAQSKDATVADLQRKIADVYAIDRSRDYLQIFTESGELIYRSSSLEGRESALMPASEVKRPLSRTRRVANRPFRFLFERLKTAAGVFVVEIGVPAEDAVNTARRVRRYSLVLGPLLVALAGLSTYWICRRSPGEAR